MEVFFILLFLLETRWIRLEQVEHGANLLLTELLLFFIPPVVGVIQYQQLLMNSGWKIVIIIFISTFMVMASSMLSVRMLLKQDEVK